MIGGGDSAVRGAAIAAQVAKTVYLIHRRNAFRAEPYWVDRVQARPNVKFVLERNVAEIVGDQKVRSVTLDKPWEGKDSIPVDGVFIEVGSIPSVELATSLGAKLDPKGFIAGDAGSANLCPRPLCGRRQYQRKQSLRAIHNGCRREGSGCEWSIHVFTGLNTPKLKIEN